MDRKSGIVFLAIYLLIAGAGFVAWPDRDDRASATDRPPAEAKESESGIVEGKSPGDGRSPVQRVGGTR